MNKTDGWISLHRRIKESSIFTKPSEWFKVWIYLLLEVNHQTGEGFFKWEAIQRDCHITHWQLRASLDFMEEENMIIRKKLPRGVEIIIQNWLDYQNKRDRPSNRPSNRPSEIEQEVSREAEQKDIKNIETPSNRPSESITEPPSISTISNNNLLNNLNNKGVNTYIPEHEIFDFWNSKKIQTHRSFEKFKRHIAAALKIYTEEEIKDAIDNYAYILSNPDRFYFTYKWEIDKFFLRGLERFLPVNFKERDFLKRVYKSKAELDEERSLGILSRVFREEEEKENDKKGNDSNPGSPEGSI